MPPKPKPTFASLAAKAPIPVATQGFNAAFPPLPGRSEEVAQKDLEIATLVAANQALSEKLKHMTEMVQTYHAKYKTVAVDSSTLQLRCLLEWGHRDLVPRLAIARQEGLQGVPDISSAMPYLESGNAWWGAASAAVHRGFNADLCSEAECASKRTVDRDRFHASAHAPILPGLGEPP